MGHARLKHTCGQDGRDGLNRLMIRGGSRLRWSHRDTFKDGDETMVVGFAWLTLHGHFACPRGDLGELAEIIANTSDENFR